MSSNRGPQYNSKEDIALCNAYLLHSRDPIRGAHQSKDDLWKNIISTYYGDANESFIARTDTSIRSRWQTISKICSEFRGAMNAHEVLNQSGSNDLDSYLGACDNFLAKTKKAFTLQHCWDILRHQPKWGRTISSNNSGSRSNVEINATINLGDDEIERQQAQDSRYKRSGGREKSKKKNKATESDPIVEEILETSRRSFEHIKDSQARHEKFMEQRHMKKSDRIGWQQKKWEAEIMEKDVTDMTPTKLQYFKNLKSEILEEQNLRSVSRSLNFADGSHTSMSGTPTSDRRSSAAYPNFQFDSPSVHSYNGTSSGYQDERVSAQPGMYSEFSEHQMHSTPMRPDGQEYPNNNSLGDQSYGGPTWNMDLNF